MACATRSITLPSKIRVQTKREYMPEDPDDPTKPCPLVPAHSILSSRLALHLVKCREALAQNVPLVQCKFDSTHWVLKKELVQHMTEECDRRELFNRYLVHPDEHSPPVQTYQPPELPQFEENWDDGPSVSYDPTLKAETEAVLRIHSVASKKERKRFRNNERLRLQELEREGKTLPGTSASRSAKPPANPPAQLRPPRMDVQSQIAGQKAEKTTPSTADVGPTVATDVAHSLGQLNLGTSPPKKDNAWVSVGKGRRKTGKKK